MTQTDLHAPAVRPHRPVPLEHSLARSHAFALFLVGGLPLLGLVASLSVGLPPFAALMDQVLAPALDAMTEQFKGALHRVREILLAMVPPESITTGEPAAGPSQPVPAERETVSEGPRAGETAELQSAQAPVTRSWTGASAVVVFLWGALLGGACMTRRYRQQEQSLRETDD